MAFSSVQFLFFFLPAFILVYFATPGIPGKNLVTVAFSLLFYAWGEPRLILVLLASIGFNMLAALAIDAAQGRLRRLALALTVTVNIALLAVFKYADFIVANLDTLLRPLHVSAPLPDIALPLGISFFIFHCMSYVIDVYRRRFAANRNLIEVALYIALFPQLIAGPIVRYATIAHQLHDRRHTLGRASAGTRIFIIGLAQKLLIADLLAPVVETIFDTTVHPNLADAWLGLLSYTLQIYFDFAGYSNMAVGLGLCLGFGLPRNFRLPYTSRSVTEFWRRWHMSLSRWLRDYLYIPLGGSRGTPIQTYRNLVVVFLLCGLWHGASWNFVLWGVWHGGFLVMERMGLRRMLDRTPGPIAWAYSSAAVMAGWVLFRTRDLAAALDYGAGLVGAHGGGDLGFAVHGALTPVVQLALAAGCVLALAPRLPRLARRQEILAIADTAWTFGLLFLSILSVAAGAYSPFLYFRF